MTPERNERVRAVFARVCELPVQEQESFLRTHCADDEELRAEVQSLIDHDVCPGESATSVTAPIPEDPFVAARASNRVTLPQHIGPYRIIRAIGEGGMGVVYLGARDDDQFRNHVAIKVIKVGMDTDEVVRRFELERQLLAALSHPNIARLIDGGATEDGRPYFVVEYIEGLSIDEYCDRNRLRIDERLALFCVVCQAVQAAHQNLVVHRDLKPSNIVVTKDGVPKLLDFGIAKLLNPQLSPIANDPTAPSLQLMTPEYASPEQVRGDPITTASDVYSLGVLLYELVTGHRPYQLNRKARAEIERIICDDDPEKPSTAISRVEERTVPGNQPSEPSTTRTVTPESVSKTREGRPERLRRRLFGDIDNIVLKAMRKEPRRRYATAEQFAEDIRRHLDGLPVTAHADTLIYRAEKFVKRNKAAVTVAAVIALSLSIGIATTTTAMRTAQAERREAEAARELAAQQQQVAEEHRELADSYFVQLRTISDLFVLELVDADPSPMPNAERMELVNRSLRNLQTLQLLSGMDSIMRRNMAFMYEIIGEIQGGRHANNLGDTAGAVRSYRAALNLRQALVDESPTDAPLRSDLAISKLRLSDIQAKSGDTAGALAAAHDALSDLRHLVVAAASPDIVLLRRLATAIQKAGNLTLETGNRAAARNLFQQSLLVRQELANKQGAGRQEKRDLSTGLVKMGDLSMADGKPVEALQWYEESLGMRNELADAAPTSLQAQRDVEIGHLWVAEAHLEMGDVDKAVQHAEIGKDIASRLVEADPFNQRYQIDLARLCRTVGAALTAADAFEPAIENCRRSITLLERIVNNDPTNIDAKKELAQSHWQLGRTLAKAEQPDDAQKHLEEALGLYTVLERLDQASVEMQRNLADVRVQLESLRKQR